MEQQPNHSNEQTADLHPEVLQFITKLTGELNGQAVDLQGQGTIDEVNGVNEGVFDIRHLPEHLDARALGAFLFTGYPNACRTARAGLDNPFVGGNYQYFRTYAFLGTSATAVLRVTCERDLARQRLSSRFELSGSMPQLIGVAGVSPIYELWSPAEMRLSGQFGVAWLDENGAALQTATAISEYRPVDISRLGNGPKHRYLKLESRMTAKQKLYVRQTSALTEM